MSMRTYIEKGYGYATFNGDNLGKVLSFVADNLSCFKDDEAAKKEFLSCESECDAADMLAKCVSSTIADIINRLENISFMEGYNSDGDCGTEEHIGMYFGLPRQYGEDVKNLTKDRVDGILEKYAEILGITEEPEEFECEYYG